MAAGWRAAMAINLDPGGGAPGSLNVWVLALTAVALALGGAHAVWRRW